MCRPGIIQGVAKWESLLTPESVFRQGGAEEVIPARRRWGFRQTEVLWINDFSGLILAEPAPCGVGRPRNELGRRNIFYALGPGRGYLPGRAHKKPAGASPGGAVCACRSAREVQA